MKSFVSLILILILASGVMVLTLEISQAPDSGYAIDEDTSPLIGMGIAQKKALARRGAMVDLQRNLLERLAWLGIGSNHPKGQGSIKEVEVLNGEWDGKAYTLKGRVHTEQGYISASGKALSR